jgi:predicted CXXCH cytochrome family protein
MMRPRAAWTVSILICCLVPILSGCDPVIRHKTLTMVFDGVPSMPPADKYCQDFHERQKELERRQAEAGSKASGPTGSQHAPYAEKRCDDCHDKAKGGLKLPKQELCLSCHTDLMAGDFAHGPAAVGDCVACHLPHTSAQPSLLVQAPGQICGVCHKEERQAAAMHERFLKQGVICTVCHNPHGSQIRFFLY